MSYEVRLLKTTAIALLLAMAVADVAPANTDTMAIEPIRIALRQTSQVSTRRIAFDWMGNRKSVRTVAFSRLVNSTKQTPRQIGRGSYICSPAGFGQKSRCYAN